MRAWFVFQEALNLLRNYEVKRHQVLLYLSGCCMLVGQILGATKHTPLSASSNELSLTRVSRRYIPLV